MTEATPDDAAAQRAAEQARLRKAKREAKIRAGGASRLNKITGLGGGFQRDDPAPTPPSTTSSPAPSATSALPKPNVSAEHADPEEIDISQHYYEPASTPRPSATGPPLDPNAMTEDQLRQMMLGFDRPGPGGAGGTPPMNPFAGPGGMGAGGVPGGEDDPLMKMLSQMMAGGGGPGGMPGFPGAGGAQGGFPAGFPGMPGMPGMQTPEQAKASSSAYLWRILHAVFAISLGLYIALTTTFSGSKLERERTALAYNYPVGSDESVTDVNSMEKGREVFFWIFATTEAILLTTRFFIERGRAPPAGMLWTVVGFLPGSIKTYAETVLRYGQIFATVRSDILVCVFVLGIASWIRG
ncbi:hypothetical protein CH63R_10130 [Colletotrichum higginsianum IMI 349063]|uniref:Sad1 interacting factor 1 n=1 Tax=Colletotrichum higginsianum (strain IMI 349063) TaxID=759273 RepID=A0A1B7Y1Y4_COLHI|nr:uncharacterized protein CH63R_10130 [Colletotrichum higginsianum IMI 349063]OBR06010.1 hypothetical protein CH63R_10130 [Colletotrichum higginsianum IMI 349063]